MRIRKLSSREIEMNCDRNKKDKLKKRDHTKLKD